MARSRYIVGIDLGTTNSVVAYLDSEAAETAIEIFDVPQLVDPGHLADENKLPSFLYLPAEHELPPNGLSLPWTNDQKYAVGVFARNHGAKVPGRLVASAKSWLCHPAVDRSAPILPWSAGNEVPKVSPIEASARYLIHLREAWNYKMAAGNRQWARLEKQDVVLTVPASFDEVARELTVEAAKKAGLEHITLLEEPQAVFYAWLFESGKAARDKLTPDDLILVCDVGGGTSDFSLIQVETKEERLAFRRIAVGDHLLLGGDNMDLALAAELEPKLAGEGRKLDSARWIALQHACRAAKEHLLGPDGPEETTVAVAGRGSSLVGGTLRAKLARETVVEKIVKGFFPNTPIDVAPQRASKAALHEFGLPYAVDAAISRHLASFLRDPAIPGSFRSPRWVLFNGGVFKPAVLRQRIVDLVTSWFPTKPPPKVLETDAAELDLAVARGAARYGLVRRGRGEKIAGGAARSYYIGLDAPSADGSPSPDAKAVCVAPQGLEEGDEVEVADRVFELLIRRPVSFPFYSSSTRPLDQLGALVAVDSNTMKTLPPIRTVLKSGRKSTAEYVRVRLHAFLTEVGTLELWCVDIDEQRRWRLQFEVRRHDVDEDLSDGNEGGVSDEDVMDQAIIDRAAERIAATFQQNPAAIDRELDPQRLMKGLETIFEKPRGDWPPNAIRGLWKPTYELAGRRRVDANFEIRWLNLAGFLLRPGYGYPLDEWRLKELWRLWNDGVVHRKNPQAKAEWWILWRRVAGGLSKGQQFDVFRRTASTIAPSGPKKKPKKLEQDQVEMWRTVASLERLSADEKTMLGETLLERIASPLPEVFEMWSLGRLGARIPFHGPIDAAIPAAAAEEWIARLLKLMPEQRLTFPLVQLSRRSGDRSRDISDGLREKVIARLEAIGASSRQIELVREVAELQAAEQSVVFGDSLPPALRLASTVE